MDRVHREKGGERVGTTATARWALGRGVACSHSPVWRGRALLWVLSPPSVLPVSIRTNREGRTSEREGRGRHSKGKGRDGKQGTGHQRRQWLPVAAKAEKESKAEKGMEVRVARRGSRAGESGG